MGVLKRRKIKTRNRSESQIHFKTKYEKFQSIELLPVESVLETPCLDPVNLKKRKFGYKEFGWDSSLYFCHRVAWEIKHGEIPKDLVVRHLCHNPSCCNVEHLKLGTPQDNSNDCTGANRQSKGEQHPKVNLKTIDIFYILSSQEKSKSLSEKFKVKYSLIRNIRAGGTWKTAFDFYHNHKGLLITPELLTHAYTQWDRATKIERLN